jgi:hypothetical protein
LDHAMRKRQESTRRRNSTSQVSDKQPRSRDPTTAKNGDAKEKTNARHDPEHARHGLGG